jgi:pimeloyl-ACP methyl ester carboxylesterase
MPRSWSRTSSSSSTRAKRPSPTSVGAPAASQILHRANGRRIGFAEYGDRRGLPVLALHGTPGSRFMFALTDEGARQRRLRVIAPERPGYGLSEDHRQDSLTEAAKDLEFLAGELKLTRFALIGVSGGASSPHLHPAGSFVCCHRRVFRLAAGFGAGCARACLSGADAEGPSLGPERARP